MLTEAGSPTPHSPFGTGSTQVAASALSPTANQPDDASTNVLFKLIRSLKRRQALFLFVFFVTTALLAANALRQRIVAPVYIGGFQMLITDPLANVGPSTPSSGVVESLAKTTSLGNSDVPTLIQLLTSPVVLKPIAEAQAIPLGSLIGSLAIGSTRADSQGVLNIQLRWSDPVQGRKILTALADSYPKYALIQRQEKLGQGLEFLGQQAPALQQRVNSLQRTLKQFRESNSFLEPLAQGGSIISSRDGLLGQLRTLQVEQAELETQLASVRSGKLITLPSPGSSGSGVVGQGSPAAGNPQLGLATRPRADSVAPSSNTVVTPQQQLSQLDQQIATARATFKSDSPQLQTLLAQRNRIKPLVQSQGIDQLSSQLFANQAQQNELNRQILLLNKNFKQSPEEIRKYEELQQKIEVAQANYLSYIQARENFRLEVAKQTVPWQVISPPVFGDVPIEPDLSREFLRALFIGLAVGIAAVLLREKTDDAYHTPKEASQELGLPILGLIPYLPIVSSDSILKSLKELPGTERFAIKESLRSLFTTFRLLRADREIRLVVITSSTQNEGMSTAASVFGNTLADLGLHVLLVDADMRLPVQHKHFAVDNVKGLSDYLGDTDDNIQDYIKPITSNLSLITAGSRAPDPARLLNSLRCSDMVQHLRALPGYDLIIFDTPPCLLLSDPVILGEKVDGILYLVGLGRVGREIAPQAIKRIKATGVDILGLMCNQVAYPTRLNDYGYEYGYHYNYSYAGYRDTYSQRLASKDVAEALPDNPSDQAQSSAASGSAAKPDSNQSGSSGGLNRLKGWFRR